MEDNIRKKKEQVLADGIILEKYQEKANDKTYYIMNIQIQMLKKMNFTVDFTGSTNIGLDENEKIFVTEIGPFEKKTVAKFELQKKWKLKTKFKYQLDLPSLEEQKKYIEADFEESEEHK